MAAYPTRLGAAATHLRLSGASYADIAETLALESPRHALRLVTAELGRNVGPAERETLRDEESARLLVLLQPVMERALNGADPEHLTAARTALAIIDRRIRLLGLDAPTELTIHTPSAQELEAWVAAHATIGIPQLEEADILDVEEVEDECLESNGEPTIQPSRT